MMSRHQRGKSRESYHPRHHITQSSLFISTTHIKTMVDIVSAGFSSNERSTTVVHQLRGSEWQQERKKRERQYGRTRIRTQYSSSEVIGQTFLNLRWNLDFCPHCLKLFLPAGPFFSISSTFSFILIVADISFRRHTNVHIRLRCLSEIRA